MDYGNPLANGLSEQPHVSGIFQRGSPRMGFDMMDVRAKEKLLQTLVGHVML